MHIDTHSIIYVSTHTYTYTHIHVYIYIYIHKTSSTHSAGAPPSGPAPLDTAILKYIVVAWEAGYYYDYGYYYHYCVYY